MKPELITLVLTSMIIALINYSNGCSCSFQHPQQHYCNSDFVILAKVKKEQTINMSIVYKVRIKREFKISEKGLIALKFGRIQTPIYDSLCGVRLEVGKKYLISGNIISLKAYTYLCNMIQEWHQVTKRQRKGFMLLYKQGCNCNIIKTTIRRRYPRHKDSCFWKSKCEEQEGICMRQENGTCMWNKNKLLATCKRELYWNATRRAPLPKYRIT